MSNLVVSIFYFFIFIYFFIFLLDVNEGTSDVTSYHDNKFNIKEEEWNENEAVASKTQKHHTSLNSFYTQFQATVSGGGDYYFDKN